MPEYHIRTSPSGRSQFMRSNSFSHHHDRHRHSYTHRCPHNCASVTVEELSNLYDQRDDLLGANESLKSALKASHQKNNTLKAYNEQLAGENEELRRSLSSDGDNIETFRRRVVDLTKEGNQKDRTFRHMEKKTGNLEARVRELTRTVSDEWRQIAELSDTVVAWQKRAGDFEENWTKAEDKFERCAVKLRRAESDIEKRDRIIRQLEGLRRPRRRFEYV